MGVYVDPPTGTKEDWLTNHGELVSSPPLSTGFELRPKDSLPVILINNGPFTAAGIAFDEQEFQEFIRPDNRPKLMFYVETKKLLGISPILKNYLTQTKE